ncbi:pyridoxal phosphate-dependent aminotransferase [Candidatus Spongiisocius sp.]|uniref:pyridoxal phosphate-dependent aminotransferase n=1 Tax=Candidatus Spongiisocius sp. TaxID=3101273 RepID=UPI003B5C8BC8
MSGVSQRIESMAESATMAITAKARALRAAGHDVIGYGAGEPDFPTPAPIVAAARAAAADPAMHKYTPAPGLPALREAVAAKTRRDSGYEVAPSQVIVTNGGKQSVYTGVHCLVDPGDEVLLPAPYWVTYPAVVELAGGVTIPLETDETSGFKVTVDQLEAAYTSRTKLLIFVSPSNPTGAVYDASEIAEIGRWAVDRGVWVLTDEIYEHLVYGDASFASLPVEVPELAEQCVIVNGVAKTYAMTGWRVGWMVAPDHVIKGATKLQGHLTSNVSNIAQAGAIEAVSGSLDDVHMMREAFDRRRRIMHRMLNETRGIDCIEPQGAFYCFASVRGALGNRVGDTRPSTALELADVCIDQAGVAFVPGEAFGAPGYARFSYALGDDDLVTGLTRLQELLGTSR